MDGAKPQIKTWDVWVCKDGREGKTEVLTAVEWDPNAPVTPYRALYRLHTTLAFTAGEAIAEVEDLRRAEDSLRLEAARVVREALSAIDELGLKSPRTNQNDPAS